MNDLLKKQSQQYRPIDYIAKQINFVKEERKVQAINSVSSKGFSKATRKISNDYYRQNHIDNNEDKSEKTSSTDTGIDFSNIFGLTNNSTCIDTENSRTSNFEVDRASGSPLKTSDMPGLPFNMSENIKIGENKNILSHAKNNFLDSKREPINDMTDSSNVIEDHNDIQSDRYELQLLSEDWSDSILLDVVNNMKEIDCNVDNSSVHNALFN